MKNEYPFMKKFKKCIDFNLNRKNKLDFFIKKKNETKILGY